ncbi:hypothetical protein Y886_37620 [Xanthomonas hyacinthi DSM 19077]|nr:hypothetical protein Y886_37620 [Xanthomonas hyacinthi DSM 19077]
MPFVSQLEPQALQQQFLAHPPQDFLARTLEHGVPTFEAAFDLLTTADPALRAHCYALYLQVYAQSEVHFDLLTAAFFDALLTDADSGGLVFTYRHQGRLIGWNLCYVHDGRLLDKYIGLHYPEAREHNLYALSWMHNLDYACCHGLRAYVAGWTDPEVKAQLGASFTYTWHAVYLRNPLLRIALRRLRPLFEADDVGTADTDADLAE